MPNADTDIQGFRPHDAILIRSGLWTGAAVGVGVNCVTDIFGAPLGCTPPAGTWATATGTFSVQFPSSAAVGQEFSFGVSALNCSACFVEYVYVAKRVDISKPKCDGRSPTQVQVNAEGHLIGTPRVDVIVGTPRGDVIKGMVLDEDNRNVGSIAIGPVTRQQRRNRTGFIYRSKTRIVPPGTRTIVVVLLAERSGLGRTNDGYADNLRLTVVDRPVIDPIN